LKRRKPLQHTHTGPSRQEKEKAENLKKKMSVSGVGGSAANVAPAVGVLRMMGKVVCRKTLNNHFFNWMFGDFQPFFFGNALESSS